MIRTTPIHAIMSLNNDSKQPPLILLFDKKHKVYTPSSLFISGSPTGSHSLFTYPFNSKEHMSLVCNISIAVDCIEGFNELLCICAKEFDNPTEQADNFYHIDKL